MQSADAEHTDTTAAAESMVHLVKVTVKDIAAGATTGAVDTDVPLYFHSKLELPEACSFPCHAQKAGTTIDGV